MHAKCFEVFRLCGGCADSSECFNCVLVRCVGEWLVGIFAGVLYSVCQGRFAVLDCLAADDRLE